jgi:uncharacterized membrane protein
MVEPFADFVIPPVIQTLGLLAGTGIILALLYGIRPPVTQRIVLAFVPWIIAGATLHVFYQIGETLDEQVYPEVIEPLFSAPAVYLTTFIPMGTIWVVSVMIVPSADRRGAIARYLAATGVGILIPLVGLLIWQGLGAELEFQPVAPTLGLIVTLAATFVVYILIGAWRTYIIAEARYVGALVLFAHLFDAITTAVGVEFMDAGERSAVPRRIMDVAADLPTADTLGTAWLFILVKLLLAVAIVVLFADYVSDKPSEGNLFFAIVAAVGLGPAVNNFFLFMLSVGV